MCDEINGTSVVGVDSRIILMVWVLACLVVLTYQTITVTFK